MPALRISRYRVAAEVPGFNAASAEGVNLTVDARLRVDLTLQVGAVSQSINVVAVTPLLETESSSKGQVIQSVRANRAIR